MNHPTREEFNQFKQEVKEEVAHLAQQTEPISLKIERGLPIPEATLLQNLMTMVGSQGPDIGKLKSDVAAIKNDVETIKSTMATYEAHLKQTEKLTEVTHKHQL